MYGARKIMNYAEYLNKVRDIRDVRKYYLDQSALLKDDVHNLTVTLLCMCVNKELSVMLSEDRETHVEEFPKKLKSVCDEISDAYLSCNEIVCRNLQIAQEDRADTLEYLNNMTGVLLSGVKYMEKKADSPWRQGDEYNEWNTRYRREERVRDNMKNLISVEQYAKFTITHKIEIPYMYTLAWDLPTLFRTFDEKISTGEDKRSYIGNLRKNTSIALRYISENMLAILLHGSQIDPERFEEDDADAIIKVRKYVDYRKLLPTIKICQKVDYYHDLCDNAAWAKARKTHVMPLVKKEVLGRVPLLPMESGRDNYDPEKSITMMVNLLKEENETKDYLESDLVYFRDTVVEICDKILHWVWEEGFSAFRIKKEEAEEYLISIIKAANNVPRTNTKANREDHIKKIIGVVAKKWDERILKDVIIDETCGSTYTEYAYFSVLKLTRNWNEHGLLKASGITFAAFIFMISIRYILETDKLDIESHREFLYKESRLFKFFKKEKIDYEKLDVAKETEAEYLKMYRAVEREAFLDDKRAWAKKFPKDEEKRDPHQVLNTAGYKESLIKDKMSEYEIYLTFWLSIHLGKAENSFHKVAYSRDPNLIELLENTYNYQRLSFLLDS